MGSLRSAGLATLILSLLLVAYLTLRSANGGKNGDADGGPPAAATLGAAPPTNVASDPKAAKHHVLTQACLADCVSQAQQCAMIADDGPKCGSERRECEAKCR